MNNNIIVSLIITVILTLVGYFIAPYVFGDSSASLAFAAGILIGGGLISVFSKVNTATSDSDSNTNASSNEFTTLYVGNLAYKVNEKIVKEHFGKVGKVNSVRLMKDKRTGKRKGYGFVEIEASYAQDAINSLNETDFFERTMKVRLAKDKQSD